MTDETCWREDTIIRILRDGPLGDDEERLERHINAVIDYDRDWWTTQQRESKLGKIDHHEG